ncbi:MAG: hypothetical protein J5506_09755 [Prevotella sp.]|nr:hypothetical protein [Prevotella sp.]
MKRIVFTALLLTSILLGANAQQYTVFYVKGEVKCQQNGKTTVLKEKQQVSEDATFVLGKGMSLILKDDANCRLPVVKGPCKGNLKKLVKKEKASILERSIEFFSHIAGKSRAQVKDEATHMRNMGSVSRRPIADKEGIRKPVEPPRINTELINVSDELESIIADLEREE